jgi:O-antigen ligase
MSRFGRWVIFCLATLAFVAPLKFGTPVVLQSLVTPPREVPEWLIFSWPNQLVVIFVFGALIWLMLDARRLAARVDTLFVLPLVFLLTQTLATPRSINPQVSADTLIYFGACVLLFYAGSWYVRDGAEAAKIFAGFGLATALVCILAVDQHFVGLQQTREFAALYVDPAAAPPEFLHKLTSRRVFGTLVYPNALAGYLVLAFAPTLAWIWVRGRTWDRRVRWATLVFVGALMVFCLALTGSRGGFVAFAAMLGAGVWATVRERSGVALGAVVVALAFLGAVFVFAQRAGLIHTGMQSLEARTDYWCGAMRIARDYFWLGTGPGTFGSIYSAYRGSSVGHTELVHNNFLQIFSDSGVLAFVVFAALWVVAMRDAVRLTRRRPGDAAALAICAALAGWVVHGLVDFDLYVPGAAVPAFLLLGALQGLKELPRIGPVNPRGRSRWLVGGLCVVLAAGVLWVEARMLAANFAYGRAVALEPVDLELALAQARRAVELAPRNATYRAAAGKLAADLGRFEEAEEHFRAARECDPHRFPGLIR